MTPTKTVDTRPAYDQHGKLLHLATHGNYVMVKRPRFMPFVLTIKAWAKLPKEGA